MKLYAPGVVVDRKKRRWAFGFLFLAWCALQGMGMQDHAEPARPVNYTRKVWHVQDGLPEDTVQALTLAQDGSLWIGTTGGMANFDGAHIRPSRPDHLQSIGVNSIFALLGDTDGSLWAGTEGGGLLHVGPHGSQVFSTSDGLNDGFVRAIYRDRGGRLWVGTDDGLYQLDGSRFRRIDSGDAIPSMAVHSIAEDSQGRIWAGGSTLISIGRGGDVLRYPLPGAYSASRVKKILQSQDGVMWVGTVGGLTRLGPKGFERVGDIGGTVRSLLETKDQTLWIGTIGEGLWTYRSGVLARVTHPGLLPSETVLTLIQDESGQVWAGTQSGLVRLNATPVSLMTMPHAGDPDFETIAGDSDGSVWVAGQSLYRIHGGVAEAVRLPQLGAASIRNVYRASDGALWVGTDGSGAYRIGKGEVKHYSAPAELTNNFIRAFLETRDHAMWIATDEGVSVIERGMARRYTQSSGLAYFSTRCLMQGRDGTLWIGTDHGLSAWRDGVFTSNTATRALAREKIWSLLEDRSGTLWFGTRDHGLFRARNGVVEEITTAQGLPTNSVYQLLQGRTGTVWLTGPNTIASMEEAQIDGQLPTAAAPWKPTVYAMPFGGDDAQMYGGRQPAGYLAADDSVWFPTTRGVAHIARTGDVVHGPAPRVSVLGVAEDGRPATLSDPVVVDAGVVRLSFTYAATDLRPRDDLRFRYRLEPFDADWVTSSEGDVATYTNLKAGHYTFRVQALEAGELESGSEASLRLTKEPHFYQAWWFYLLTVVFMVGSAWALYRLRLRRIRHRFAAVLEERSRMAREIHDTVIQGCTGLSAVLEAMAITSANGGDHHELLEYARGQTQATIHEARRAVWDMRHEREDDLCVVEALEGLAAQIMREHAEIDVQVTGLAEVRLRTSALHEVMMTVREAANNAVHHSGTGRIEMSVVAEGEDVVVRVRDFGRGMDGATMTTPPAGHFGLVGMRERIKRLGGRLEIASVPAEGTTVALHVPRAGRRTLDAVEVA